MSIPQGWNLLNTCKKGTCNCINLSEATYVAVLGDASTLPVGTPTSVMLQINDGNTFVLQLDGTTPVYGAWDCCNGIWCGVAVLGRATPVGVCNEGAVDLRYTRYTLEICPKSLKLKYRIVNIAVPATACISDVPAECETPQNNITEVKLQKLNNVCKVVANDFALPVIN
jgi:hypothetical protein